MLICFEPNRGVIYWRAKLHSHLYGHINLSDADVCYILRVAMPIQYAVVNDLSAHLLVAT